MGENPGADIEEKRDVEVRSGHEENGRGCCC
jgi:hypothetical protein